MPKVERILPLAGRYGVEWFRAGHRNAQGWPAERRVASGRARCRCCGKKIAKGETALVAWVKWTDTNNAWSSADAWLHLDCQHAGETATTRVVAAGDY